MRYIIALIPIVGQMIISILLASSHAKSRDTTLGRACVSFLVPAILAVIPNYYIIKVNFGFTRNWRVVFTFAFAVFGMVGAIAIVTMCYGE